MLNNFTVSTLVKSVIVLMSVCLMALLCVTAWDSWTRLTMTSRISVVTDASASLFKAMHNLRTDRSSTNRAINDNGLLQPDMDKYIRSIRDAEMPAMKSAAEVLATANFTDQKTLLPELNRLIQALTALQAESWDAVSKPKASRRATLAKDYMENTQALLDTLDRISVQLAAAVNHNDPVIDQLLMIKQTAWLFRNTAGEASVLVSNGAATGHVTPENHLSYIRFVGGIDAAWNALQTVSAGTDLPPSLTAAMAAAKTAYFDPQYMALRDRLIDASLKGEKGEITAEQWTPLTVTRMGTAVAVAERALDAAKDYTSAQHSEAERALALQLALLV
jgi:hypothetical protein